jgi:hypothetical protein
MSAASPLAVHRLATMSPRANRRAVGTEAPATRHAVYTAIVSVAV